MDALGNVLLTDGPYALAFLAGYALRAYISHRRRRRWQEQDRFGTARRPKYEGT